MIRNSVNYSIHSLFLLILLIPSTCIIAQVESPTCKYTSDRLISFYNSNSYDSIFKIFSPSMQRFLPPGKTKEFFTDLKASSGKVSAKEFDHYHADYAIYKTTFEKEVAAFNIAIEKDSTISGLFVQPFEPDLVSKPERTFSKLILPFNGEWTVSWGGDTRELNHHVNSKAQKNAFDILIRDSLGQSFRTNGITNEDYFAFGQEIISPCNGEVVLAVDGIKDNQPGDLNPIYIPGNTVIVKTSDDEYLYFAHFKQFSVNVKQGQKVKKGHLLGLCGNSGNSSEPHLHFHIQNLEDMSKATGIKCYFEKIRVNKTLKTDYSPLKDERVENLK